MILFHRLEHIDRIEEYRSPLFTTFRCYKGGLYCDVRVDLLTELTESLKMGLLRIADEWLGSTGAGAAAEEA